MFSKQCLELFFAQNWIEMSKVNHLTCVPDSMRNVKGIRELALSVKFHAIFGIDIDSWFVVGCYDSLTIGSIRFQYIHRSLATIKVAQIALDLTND